MNSAPSSYGPFTPSGLLQRTFAMYREQPKLMFGLMLMVAAVEVITTGVITGSTAMMRGEPGMRLPLLQTLLFLCICLMAWLLVYVVSQVVHGAYFYAVTARLQERPIGVGEAASRALEHVGRLVGVSLQLAVRIFGYVLLIGIAIEVILGILAAVVFLAVHGSLHAPGHGGNWMAYALILVPLLAVAVTLYLIAMLWVVARYAVAIPACLAENLPASDSIRRSIALSAKSKSRIYAMYVFVMVLGIASFLIIVPISLLSARSGHTPVFLLLSAVASAANLLFGAWLLSFTGIASTLCYYDLRVRKEGFGAVVVETKIPAVVALDAPAPDLSAGDLPVS